MYALLFSNGGPLLTGRRIRYDSHGVFSAPRALFMFKAFGHERASVLDGGLPRWEEEGFSVETTKPVEPTPTEYELPSLDRSVIRSQSHLPPCVRCH